MWRTFLLMVLLVKNAIASFVTLQQGGYNNVVLAFANQVQQPANCTQFLNNVEVSIPILPLTI